MKLQKIFSNSTSIVIALLLLGVIVFAISKTSSTKKQGTNTSVSDYKNATYTIDGEKITLENGKYEGASTTDSASLKTIITYFGNEVTKDINGDGKDDVVFLITKTTGGSGVFFYAVAALTSPQGFVGSHAILIGDRIAPQTTESGPYKSVIVNYVDRAPGEGFTTKPSIGKSLQLILDPTTMQFGEVAQNFEGEADPSKMTLTMKKWNLEKIEGVGILDVKNKTAFSLTFLSDGKVSFGTDCNKAQGSYTSTRNNLTISSIITTEMYCKDSDEQLFIKNILDTTEYSFTSRGQLILKGKTTSVYFR